MPVELTSSLPYILLVIGEELLVENVQAEESIFSTVTLFGGFLALLVLKLLEPNYTLHGHKLRLFTLWEAQFVTGGIITGT